MNDNSSILGKDIPFNIIDSEVCRVLEFNTHAKIENNNVKAIPNFPYAFLTVECNKLQGKAILYVTHKLDFTNLWRAYKERGINKEEEVLVFWSNKHYKSPLIKLASAIMPKLWIMVCKKGAYELMTDKNYKPELTGEARFLAERAIIEWKPDVME